MNEAPIPTQRRCTHVMWVTWSFFREHGTLVAIFPLGALASSVLPCRQRVRKIIMIRVVQTLRVLPVEAAGEGDPEDTEYGFA